MQGQGYPSAPILPRTRISANDGGERLIFLERHKARNVLLKLRLDVAVKHPALRNRSIDSFASA